MLADVLTMLHLLASQLIMCFPLVAILGNQIK